MIKVQDLKKIYNERCVLDMPELTIPKGESFGLVGNNGAGKTTFFSLLLDLISPTTGFIENNEIIVNKNEGWKQFSSAFLDESFLITYLTPEEYFYFIGELRGVAKTDVDAFLTSFTELFNDEILEQKKYIRDLSKGNQKKVGVIGALIGQPEIIILDEPFANLDPTTQYRLKGIFKQIATEGKQTLIISSHDIMHTTEVCSRIVVLEKGNIVKDMETSPETMKELENFFAGVREEIE